MGGEALVYALSLALSFAVTTVLFGAIFESFPTSRSPGATSGWAR